jgi:ferric-dicitrate binding protein FerR (iron transport regulator)
MTKKELDRAIQNALDGTLLEAGCLELRAVLKSDPGARALYYEYASIDQALAFRASGFSQLDAARSLADIRMLIQRRHSVRLSIAAVAAVLLAVFVVMHLVTVTVPKALATYEVGPGSQFTIERPNSEEDSSANTLSEGSIVNLTHGSFELVLQHGTRGVVVAPAKFQLHNEMELDLTYGTVWVHVSHKGEGFKVKTPEFLVTDLGTKFGVESTTDAADEVHVFSGTVEVSVPSGIEERLKGGQARRLVSGKLQSIPVETGHFLTDLPENLIVNGDFEAGSRPSDANYGVPATTALLPGWNFGSDIAVTLNASSGKLGHGHDDSTIFSSTADVQVGFRNGPTNYTVGTLDDSIWQTFSTVPGQLYEVSFEMGAYFPEIGNLRVRTAVYNGAATSGSPLAQTSASHSGKTLAESGYRKPTKFTFTAESSRSTIVLTETSPNTHMTAVAIDNVSVLKVSE